MSLPIIVYVCVCYIQHMFFMYIVYIIPFIIYNICCLCIQSAVCGSFTVTVEQITAQPLQFKVLCLYLAI